MLKKLLIPLLILLISSPVRSWDKSKFDLITENEPNALKKITGMGYDGQEIKKSVSEITLIQGGYFTIGTNQGLSATRLDDQCGITFGHPYALTSYPLLSIDGSCGKPESFFNIYDSQPQLQGDSLLLSYSSNNIVQFNFSLKPDVSGKTITLTFSLKNLDTQPHSFGIGLVFDPGLGKKGDGWAEIDAKTILRDTLLAGSSVPTQILINERNGLVDGMKVQLDFPVSPEKLIFANWNDLYENHTPNFSPSLLRKIYDLTLKIIWSEQSIPAGGVLSRTIIFDMQQPDFNTSLFMHWDLPGFLSLENNLLFPRAFDSFVEITNLTANAKPNSQLEFQFPGELFSGTANYQLAVLANEIVYQSAKMQSQEIYEDEIVDLTVTLKHDGQILDAMLRQVFIPAVPLSDTGLVCTIDTVMTPKYPQIDFIFEAQVQTTGQKIFNLTPENVFLYENNNRISKFSMNKDTTGGASMADIVFVLDVTGSMGNEINKVKNNIIEFTDSLEANGIDYRLGLVCFLDIIESVYDFNNDPQVFKNNVTLQYAHGGDDRAENSLDALYRAAQFPFRESAKRMFIWITDADFHEKDGVTSRSRQEVINELLLKDIVVHSIGAAQFQTNWYNPIIEPTGGNFYDIYGNFRDILLDISRLNSTSRFLIAYTSPGAIQGANQIKLKLHYAGLGGIATAEYDYGGAGNHLEKTLSCHPNPFNPTVQITVNLPENGKGKVEIFNILGQRVRSFQLEANDIKTGAILWDARDEFDHPVGVGTYLVRLALSDQNGKISGHEFAKILYLK